MQPAVPPSPTLWRTCRALANRTRLQMFSLLLREPGVSVANISVHLGKSVSVASEYLRALEARGLLTVRRRGQHVTYALGIEKGERAAPRLVASLRRAFQREGQMIGAVFKLATAFTHPRRIEIFRALSARPRTLGGLQRVTRISSRALVRHLRKLADRGFITFRQGTYTVIKRTDAFGGELARLAAQARHN